MHEVRTFCALCVSRCGAIADVDHGRLLALRPDPDHPTGAAVCIKGKAAPELVHHPDRLRSPLVRTRPKGDSDPGWRRIGWDEALDTTARRLLQISQDRGPESIVFASASPSTSAMSDSIEWVQRLRRAIGSPNFFVSMELCGWGRYLAPLYTYGASVPGAYLPDLERAGCILYWGYNPSVARLTHATGTAAAIERGATLIVIDPRRAGLAHRADHWLRVRPGTDGALALAIADVMIERGWFDRNFVTQWTNGPLLVRADTGRFLRERDLTPGGDDQTYVAWDEAKATLVTYDAKTGRHQSDPSRLALSGEIVVPVSTGTVSCRPAFQLVADACRRHEPSVAEALTGVAADDIVRTARTLWHSRPVAYYAWSGVEQQSNATQIARAIGQLYALTGSLDAPGGNVLFSSVPANPVDGADLLSSEQRQKALGLPERPLGPSQFEFVTSDEIYTAILESRPYRVSGLVGFGANLVMAQPDSARGRRALTALDFFVHADLFMIPTAALADIVLPAASPFETETLKIGFEISQQAQRFVQLRPPVVPPQGEARSDMAIVFDLATRMGFGPRFWNGDIDAAWRHQLAPSGVSLDQLRANRGAGVQVTLETRHRKFVDQGFNTPSRKIEFYSETLADHGYSPLPEFAEPLMSPRSRPDLADRFPLVLTCAKSLWYCESQQRGLPSLRRRAPDPEVELHPETARARSIVAGDWVQIESPHGRARARAKLNRDLHPDVVCGQHGWWQACAEIGAPGFDPFGPDTVNFNVLIGHRPADPISGSVPMRGYMCEIRRVDTRTT